jgi:hypothetical protein
MKDESTLMKRNSDSASAASAKPVYKYEKLDRYAGYGILGLSAFLILSFLYLVIKSWPI